MKLVCTKCKRERDFSFDPKKEIPFPPYNDINFCCGYLMCNFECSCDFSLSCSLFFNPGFTQGVASFTPGVPLRLYDPAVWWNSLPPSFITVTPQVEEPSAGWVLYSSKGSEISLRGFHFVSNNASELLYSMAHQAQVNQCQVLERNANTFTLTLSDPNIYSFFDSLKQLDKTTWSKVQIILHRYNLCSAAITSRTVSTNSNPFGCGPYGYNSSGSFA